MRDSTAAPQIWCWRARRLDATWIVAKRKTGMTLCRIAIVANCKQFPAFSVCPLKGVIGDDKEPPDTSAEKTGAARKPE